MNCGYTWITTLVLVSTFALDAKEISCGANAPQICKDLGNINSNLTSIMQTNPSCGCDPNLDFTPSYRCPAFLVRRAFDDRNSSGLNPYAICLQSVKPTSDQSAMEYEEMLRKEFGFTPLPPAQPVSSSSCTPPTLNGQIIDEDQRKTVVAEYYTSMARIRNAELILIEEMNNLGSLIEDARRTCGECAKEYIAKIPIEECVDLTIYQTAAYCKSKCPRSFNDFAHHTRLAAERVRSLRQELQKTKDPAERQRKTDAINLLESQNPVETHKYFREVQVSHFRCRPR